MNRRPQTMPRNEYWNEETPMIADTGKNVLRYFPKAGRLQISNPQWEKDGKQMQGKTVTLNVTAAADNAEAVRLLKAMMKDIEEQGRQ